VDANIYIKGIGRYLEGKFIRRNRSRRGIVYISRRFLVRTKKRVWRR